MGHKVNPVSFRIGIKRDYISHWWAQRNDFSKFLLEDLEIRKFLNIKCKKGIISYIEIKRKKNNVGIYQMFISVHVAYPGVLIGQNNENLNLIKSELLKKIIKTCKILRLEFIEVKNIYLDAHIVAQIVAHDIEKRVSFRKAQKKAIYSSMKAGAKGCRITVGGRLNGIDIARSESFKEGTIPLHTLNSNIDFAIAEAKTTYGNLGIKVWICRGDFEKKIK